MFPVFLLTDSTFSHEWSFSSIVCWTGDILHFRRHFLFISQFQESVRKLLSHVTHSRCNSAPASHRVNKDISLQYKPFLALTNDNLLHPCYKACRFNKVALLTLGGQICPPPLGFFRCSFSFVIQTKANFKKWGFNHILKTFQCRADLPPPPGFYNVPAAQGN